MRYFIALLLLHSAVAQNDACWPTADCTTSFQQTECDGCINADSEYWCTGVGSGYYAPQGACTWGQDPSSGGGGGGTATCDFQAPTNGGRGDCPDPMSHDTTCEPTCDAGYTLSGTSSCNDGTLTSATCEADSGGGADCVGDRDCTAILASYNTAGCCGGDGGGCSTDRAEYKACNCCNN